MTNHAGAAFTRRHFVYSGLCSGLSMLLASKGFPASRPPNIVYMYADDLGYGDVSCYGARRVSTPNIDRLASAGVRFTNAHSSAATCTPSRYSLMTGEYAWRKKGTGVLPGNANLIIEPGRYTLPAMLKRAGYTTGAIGKWHLGLGKSDVNWNGDITPGPLEIGFDYAYYFPATGDRTPCVFIENHNVVGLDPNDPITVSYGTPIPGQPTGKDNPELLRLKPSAGHDNTIVNGISRIGYMSGGKSARWVDENIADTLTGKALSFIEKNRRKPFFLYFATHDIHVPRVPHPRFVGKTPMGPRGDAIVQLDWCVGQVMEKLDRLGLSKNTLFIFTSDNGPVLDDGYQDQAVELAADHKPAGPLRGGKYSAYDGGTRVPFIARWPGRIKSDVSNALLGQVDMVSTLADLTEQKLPDDAAPDSFDVLPALLGKSKQARDHIVEHASARSLIVGDWKVIDSSKGGKYSAGNETGNSLTPQLYNIAQDPGERNNLADQYPDRVKNMLAQLAEIQKAGRSRK